MGEQNLEIANLDIGFSVEGLEEYKSKLQIDLIEGTSEKLNNTQTMFQVINAGWQGTSRDKFITEFNDTISKIITDLQAEYEDLQARLGEIQNNYFEQDNNLMNS